MSDHDIVITKINIKARLAKKKPRKIYLYRKGDMDKVRSDISSSFEEFLANKPETKSVDENWTYFKTALFSTLNKHIPQKLVCRRWNIPWMTAVIRKQIRKKQRLYNKAKKSGKDSDWKDFRDLRKHIKGILEKAHSSYVENILDVNLDGENKQEYTIGKRFWKYIKSKRRYTMGIPLLKYQDREVTDSVEKASLLSNQYESVFTDEDLTNIPSLGTSDTPAIGNLTFNRQGIAKLLAGLNPKKANGPDKIPVRVLKEAADEIAQYLLYIFTQSLQTGEVPQDWLTANITAQALQKR